jgi:hypothetical protein
MTEVNNSKNNHGKTHRMTGGRFYQIWRNMHSRCENPNVPYYKKYGAVGVKVCDRWFSFTNFMEDMLSTYKENLTIDRIDNSKGYSPDNCRWATRKEQALNRERKRIITWNGITKHLSEWGEYLGIKSSTLRQRFYVYKWSIEKCFTYNINRNKSCHT